jgi:hypothetical protein
MKPQHFIIQEYNRKTQQYITVGDAWGADSETAKLNFIEQSNWKPQRNVILFAQHPVCR